MKIIKAIQINYQLFTFLKSEQVHPQRRKNEQVHPQRRKTSSPPTT